ncbi:ParA family protein [Candidatus Rhabdochlamydia sp. T3358]|jgi:chromosome partitioning protein|uniref:ParA family protein n=1 Tax=Candidatus Rhabdochlamydia sp. T3358 TaxID=2099795 RepID=UPI0010B43823|nr:ParA family protein [Candidatus Rhabdochlamydia sp. T3358]VHN99533.1 Sporulation initiation inhibitor protein Soj [Candidatus Rhabdochlamydia sp. T3358]
MPRIAVSSFKGGTAKTSTSLHLGAALAKFHQQKVLLIDFDAQANLTAGLGYDPDAQDSIASVLQGTKDIHEVILPSGIANLDLIPADTYLERVEVRGALAADRYSHERLKQTLNLLQYDTIIIDTPPSLCWLTESALIAADYSLVCVSPEFYSIKGLQRLSEFMQSIADRHSLQVLGVALSFWNPRGKSNQAFLEIIESTFPGKMLQTKVRRDISVSEASIFGKPLFEIAPKSRASEDYISLTKELLTRM